MNAAVRSAAPWLAWWLTLFWLWLLLAGAWNSQEWVAAAAAATAGAVLAEVARRRTGFAARLPLRAFADLPHLVLGVFVDFGVLVWALVASVARRRVVRGRFRVRALPAGGDVGLRAWIEVAASYSPNAYVADIDREEGVVLLHDLVPRRSSERPA